MSIYTKANRFGYRLGQKLAAPVIWVLERPFMPRRIVDGVATWAERKQNQQQP